MPCGDGSGRGNMEHVTGALIKTWKRKGKAHWENDVYGQTFRVIQVMGDVVLVLGVQIILDR